MAKRHCYRVAARIAREALAALTALVDIARISGIFEMYCPNFRQGLAARIFAFCRRREDLNSTGTLEANSKWSAIMKVSKH